MCAMMYRQRPSMPAVLGAVLVCIVGVVVVHHLRSLLHNGEVGPEVVLFAGGTTCLLSGALVIVAFARYQFTHLWKSTGAVHSDKYKNKHRKRKKAAGVAFRRNR